MRKVVTAACAAGVLMAAHAAAAQAPGPGSAQVAAAKAKADAIIAQARADRFFVNVTTGATPSVRHVPSGMVCDFDPDRLGAIQLYPSAIPGEDVGCGLHMADCDGHPIEVTQYATRYPAPRTVAQDLEISLASIRGHLPDARRADGTFHDMLVGTHPVPHQSVRLQATDEKGQVIFTRASSAVVRGWVVSQRLTTLVAYAQVADLLGEIIQAKAAEDVNGAVISDKAVADAQVSATDAAGDEARRLLKGVADPSLFADLTANGRTRIRHGPSGVTCDFGHEPGGNVLLVQPNVVICQAAREFDVVHVEIIYLPGLTDAALQGMMGRYVAAQFPKAKPYDGAGAFPAAQTTTGPAAHHTERFSMDLGSGPVFMRIATAHVGDWLVIHRVMARQLAVKLADERAEDEVTTVLRDALAVQAAPRAASAPVVKKAF